MLALVLISQLKEPSEMPLSDNLNAQHVSINSSNAKSVAPARTPGFLLLLAWANCYCG